MAFDPRSFDDYLNDTSFKRKWPLRLRRMVIDPIFIYFCLVSVIVHFAFLSITWPKYQQEARGKLSSEPITITLVAPKPLEPETEPEPELPKPKPIKKAKPKVTKKVARVKPKPQPKPEPTLEPVLVPEPVELDPVVEPQPIEVPEPVIVATVAPKPKPEPKPEPIPEPVPEKVPAPKPKPIVIEHEPIILEPEPTPPEPTLVPTEKPKPVVIEHEPIILTPDPLPEAEPTPEPIEKPKPVVIEHEPIILEPDPLPEPEPTPAPVEQAKPVVIEHEPIILEPVPVPAPEPTPEPMEEQKPVVIEHEPIVLEPDPVPEPELTPEPIQEPTPAVTEPESPVEPEPVVEPEPMPEAEPEPVDETEKETEKPKVEPVPKPVNDDIKVMTQAEKDKQKEEDFTVPEEMAAEPFFIPKPSQSAQAASQNRAASSASNNAGSLNLDLPSLPSGLSMPSDLGGSTSAKSAAGKPKDMLGMVKQNRGARAAAGDAGALNQQAMGDFSGSPSTNQQGKAQKKARMGARGIFKITTLRAREGTFAFHGWVGEFSNEQIRYYAVEARNGEDIQKLMIKEMITVIEEHYQGDFKWFSHRLNETVSLSARPEDRSFLEAFLLQDFKRQFNRKLN